MIPLLKRLFALGLLVAALNPSLALAQEARRAITDIAGDLYRFQNNFHYSVFLVTPDGVIVTDPINAEAASWLKGQIAERFGLPIRYLVYSHDHADHRAYHEELYAAVLAAARNGKSLDEMQKSITMSSYSAWQQYEQWRALNVEGMLNQVQLHRRGN